jgi:hypothetical protein
MNLIIRLLITAIVAILTKILPGVHFEGLAERLFLPSF